MSLFGDIPELNTTKYFGSQIFSDVSHPRKGRKRYAGKAASPFQTAL